MSNMKITPELEAVARAICKDRKGPEYTEQYWIEWISPARAALMAIRDPTGKMLDRGPSWKSRLDYIVGDDLSHKT